MSELSSAAQAVLDASEDDCIHPTDLHKIVAAALRAAADQVMPNEWPTIEDYNEYDQGFNFARITYRNELLAIAAELEQFDD